MKTYTHLTQGERYHIEVLRKEKISLSEIARGMGRHKSTLSRELKRNKGGRGYRYQQANDFAQQRHADKPKAIKMTDELKTYTNARLQEHWSPEQISGRLKCEGKASISHETIYRYILADKKAGGYLYTHLRHQAKKYRKRYGKKDYRGQIPNRVDISQRPCCVDKKVRLGDWEGDTVIGKGHKGVFVTLTERVSKLNIAICVPRKEAVLVKDAIIQALQGLKTWVKTITFDNGREFCQHEEIAQQLECETFFAKPYASWQRGLNENHNGLLRQYFPKQSRLDTVTQQELDKATNEMNHRPRKSLNYRTPWEVFFELSGQYFDSFPSVALMT
jgi:IS30 family transposase